MSRRRSDRKARPTSGGSTTNQPATSTAASPETPFPGLFIAGILCLLLATVMSAMLVLDHLGGLSLPGCGPGSPCAQAAASIWGKVPLINWPVSFLGFAYFVGALIAWLGLARGVPAIFRWLVRLGALISLGFLCVIIFGGYHCWYCLLAHAGNLGFWACVEFSRKFSPMSFQPITVTASAFVVVTVVLGLVDFREKRIAAQKQETMLAESTSRIIDASKQQKPPPAAQPPQSAQEQPTASTAVTVSATQPEEYPFPNGLTGRYRQGPEQSPVRVVMFTDYQCTDCNRIEKDVRRMMSERTDTSLSIKNFPMCADCNEKFKEQNMHPNACWAARAAEAAGILRGNDGFWQMHHWLFDHQGSFTDQELKQGLAELGYDPQQFIPVMMSPQTLKLVTDDIAEGLVLGLHFTPMVFINGVELKGVFAPQAIPRAVAAVAAKNPPPMTSANDRPALAAEKGVSDWREGTVQFMPPDSHPWPNGPDNARVKIVMWSDYQEKETPKVDAIIRKFMAGRNDTQYIFRHFPFNRECNSTLQRTGHPLACMASQAAEAAGKLGGADGYWKMHAWLMEHQAEVNEQTIRQAAAQMGFNAEAFSAAMASPETKEAIAEDVQVGNAMLYRGGIPTIYVNGKVIPRWRLDDRTILDLILNEAGQAAPAPQ